MNKRVGFSSDFLTYDSITYHHLETENALRVHFKNPSGERYLSLSRHEINSLLDMSLAHQDHQDTLSLLAYLEARFRIDYLFRCQSKRKDSLSKEFRVIYKKVGSRASLEDEILATWKKYGGLSANISNGIHQAFKFRHWLAHGRYWVPKFSKRYDFFELSELVEALVNSGILKAPEQMKV